MNIMKRQQQQVMTVVEAKVDSGTDHNMPVFVVVRILSLKVLLDRGTRVTSI
jgi:hypothetical protein